jgi:hypothetical protein
MQRANSIAGLNSERRMQTGTENSPSTKIKGRRLREEKDVLEARSVMLAPVWFLRFKPVPQNMGITFITHHQDKIICSVGIISQSAVPQDLGGKFHCLIYV